MTRTELKTKKTQKGPKVKKVLVITVKSPIYGEWISIYAGDEDIF